MMAAPVSGRFAEGSSTRGRGPRANLNLTVSLGPILPAVGGTPQKE